MFTGTFTLRSRKSRHDHSSGNVRVCENEDMFESVGTWWRNLTHRHGDDRNNDDTLDDATNTLLSILPLASIVVDEHDEVIRAHPDAIADDTVASAVHEVRAHGGKKQFSLTTTTLHEPKKAPKAGKPTMREVAKQALIGQSPDKPVTTVSRPNWLKVIVGRLNERFVVVLVSDVSETVRFSVIPSSPTFRSSSSSRRSRWRSLRTRWNMTRTIRPRLRGTP